MIGGTGRIELVTVRAPGGRSRTAVVPSVLLDQGKEWLARLERTVGVLESLIQVNHGNVLDADHRGVPTAVLNTAVEPVDVAVGAVRASNLLCVSRSGDAIPSDEKQRAYS